jgi:AcrR family transcriptional regulator
MIIEAAEKMFAKDGIEGVSLRQIRVAIGSANTNVVAYHFGAKEDLVEAIVWDRHALLDRRRGELLSVARKRGADDIETLMHANWYPFFELKNSEGIHAYAGFMDSIGRADWRWVNLSIKKNFPVGYEIADMIKEKLPKESRNYSDARFLMVFEILASALQYSDRFYLHNEVQAKRLFRTALRIATAALLTA